MKTDEFSMAKFVQCPVMQLFYFAPPTDDEGTSHATSHPPGSTSPSANPQRHFPSSGGTANQNGQTNGVAAVTPIAQLSQLSPISPTLPMSQISQPYTADVCNYGPIYNAYNYASAGGNNTNNNCKVRTNSPYSRTAPAASVYTPSYHHHPHHHPHQNPFPQINPPFYPARAVQNPYDYSPR